MRIVGLSALYHDSAAALLVDGRLRAAAQEERFTRRKHDAAFPRHALAYCLREAGLTLADIDFFAFYDKPLLKFERLLETHLAFAPRGYRSFALSTPVWLREKLFLKSLLCRELQAMGASRRGLADRLVFSEHHLSHAASAYYPSPFEHALVLTMDGVGEWATTSLAVGQGAHLEVVKEIHFPHSLGLLYSAFTQYTGFKVNSGEYKVMGLAPYGEPKYADLILENLLDLKADGSFRLNLDYFDYCTGATMVNARFHALFGAPPRTPEQALTQRDMDLAASIQAVTEEVVLRLTRSLAAEYALPHLCLAGGVALNCVANGKVLRDGRFARVWIQPAAGDAGAALGAAYATHHLKEARARVPLAADARDHMQGGYLGPAFAEDEIEARLTALGARYSVLNDDQLIAHAAQALARGEALGWFQGRMEFGPRALGARSILGDARSPVMQSLLNQKVKFRESFRPFAPAVLREDVSAWFDLDVDSPYMMLVAAVAETRRLPATAADATLFGLDRLLRPRSSIPAVTHVDYSARIQTVHADTNPRFHALLSAFKQLTGTPVLVNTSFNVRGEPIVCTPEDAFRCFMGTDIENLAIGRCWLHKAEQDSAHAQRYEARFELD